MRAACHFHVRLAQWRLRRALRKHHAALVAGRYVRAWELDGVIASRVLALMQAKSESRILQGYWLGD